MFIALVGLFMLIGFSGKKGSGKSYFADYLVNHKLFIKLSFASPLKEITKILFNLSDEDVKDPIKKELINPKFNASPRELMQWLGTDIMREEFNKKFNYSGSIWIDSVKDKVKTLLDNNKDVVIDDVRFQNEVDMIHSLGGIVINLRNDLDNTLNNSTSIHSSENQKLTFNYEFVNDKSYSNTYDIYLNLDLLINKHYGLL